MKKWQLKEKKDSKDFLGRRIKGSGNQWASPGDIKNAVFLIDSKYTSKKSYSITLETWNKIADEALLMYKYPMLSLKIQDTELVVLSKEDFIHLTTKKS